MVLDLLVFSGVLVMQWVSLRDPKVVLRRCSRRTLIVAVAPLLEPG